MPVLPFFRNANDQPSRFSLLQPDARFGRLQDHFDDQSAFVRTDRSVQLQRPKLKGVAPVAVVQLLNRGVYPKAGVQYVLLRKEVTLFTWLVSEPDNEPVVDHFLLVRYTPKITERYQLFLQAESISAFPSQANENRSLHNALARAHALRLSVRSRHRPDRSRSRRIYRYAEHRTVPALRFSVTPVHNRFLGIAGSLVSCASGVSIRSFIRRYVQLFLISKSRTGSDSCISWRSILRVPDRQHLIGQTGGDPDSCLVRRA